MAVKELIEARWKAIIGIVVCLVIAAALAGSYDLLKNLLTDSTLQQIPSSLQDQVQQLLGKYDVYVWGQWYSKNGTQVLAILAAVLGCGLIGAEANKGTIFFLLSKPVSRMRALLVKYAISAALLLVMSVAGGLGIL